MPLFGRSQSYQSLLNCEESSFEESSFNWIHYTENSGDFKGEGNQIHVAGIRGIDQLHLNIKNFYFESYYCFLCPRISHPHGFLTFILQPGNEKIRASKEQLQQFQSDLRKFYQNFHLYEIPLTRFNSFLVRSRFHHTFFKDRQCLAVTIHLKGASHTVTDAISTEVIKELMNLKLGEKRRCSLIGWLSQNSELEFNTPFV